MTRRQLTIWVVALITSFFVICEAEACCKTKRRCRRCCCKTNEGAASAGGSASTANSSAGDCSTPLAGNDQNNDTPLTGTSGSTGISSAALERQFAASAEQLAVNWPVAAID